MTYTPSVEFLEDEKVWLARITNQNGTVVWAECMTNEELASFNADKIAKGYNDAGSAATLLKEIEEEIAEKIRAAQGEHPPAGN